MNFVIAAVFDNYINAHLTLGRLQEENINCWLKDEHTISIYPGSTFAAGGIKLMVAEPQLERALTLINEDKPVTNDEHLCPYCGSGNIEKVSTPRRDGSILGAIASIVLNAATALPADKMYRCADCAREYETG
ncbi:putative signal transducing protein [Niabella aquatica]